MKPDMLTDPAGYSWEHDSQLCACNICVARKARRYIRRVAFYTLATAALILSLFLFLGCAAQVGPNKFMLAKWDICGWEGGVRFDVEFMAVKMGLGCITDPDMVSEDPNTPE